MHVWMDVNFIYYMRLYKSILGRVPSLKLHEPNPSPNIFESNSVYNLTLTQN